MNQKTWDQDFLERFFTKVVPLKIRGTRRDLIADLQAPHKTLINGHESTDTKVEPVWKTHG